MASNRQEINILRVLLLVLATLPFIRTTNIDCNGKAFHCVNSTHFMICVDIGHGLSSTVDDFVIPCPMYTVCRTTNTFECEYPPEPSRTATTTTVPTTIQVIDLTTTIQQIETTTIGDSNIVEYQNKVGSLDKDNYVTIRESRLEENITTELGHTGIAYEPPTAKRILEELRERSLDFTINKIDIGNNLTVSATVSDTNLDPTTTIYPASAITSTPDITESYTQVDEIKTINDSAMNLTTENNIFAVVEVNGLSGSNIDLTADVGLSPNDLVITSNKANVATETLANYIYKSPKATNTHTSNTVSNDTATIFNTTKDEIVGNSIKDKDIVMTTLSSDNVFVAANTEALTEFPTVIIDIQDTSNTSPQSVFPTDSIVVDVLDSSTVLMNDLNGLFTTELVPTQDLRMPLTSHNLPEMLGTDSTDYTMQNSDSIYNKEAIQMKAKTTKNDSQVNTLGTESLPLYFLDTSTGTIINEEPTLGGSFTEPGNSNVYYHTTDYTEKPFTTSSYIYVDDKFQQNADYTTQNNVDLITKATESKHNSSSYLIDQKSKINEGIVISSTSYYIGSPDQDLITTELAITASTINLEYSPKSSKNTTRSKNQLSDINFTKKDQDRPPYDMFLGTVANEVETGNDFFDQVEFDVNLYNKSLSRTLENLTLAEPIQFPQKSKLYGAVIIENQTEYPTVTEEHVKTASIRNISTNTDNQYYPEITTKLMSSLSLDGNATTQSLHNMLSIDQPEEKDTGGKSHSNLDNIPKAYTTNTTLPTSSNVIYITTSLVTPKTTIHESLAEVVTENFTPNIIKIPDVMSTTLPVELEEFENVTENLILTTLSGEISYVLNNNITNEKFPATDFTIEDNTETYNEIKELNYVLDSSRFTIEDSTIVVPTTTQSIIDGYSNYYDTVLLSNHKSLKNEMATKTQSNAEIDAGTSFTKYVHNSNVKSEQDMILENVFVSTTVPGEPDAQIEEVALISVPITIGQNIIAYDYNLGYAEKPSHKKTLTIESKETNSKKYDEKKISNNAAHHTFTATEYAETTVQTSQNPINVNPQYYDTLLSGNYVTTTSTATKSDIGMTVSEYLDHEMAIPVINSTSSSKYLHTSTLQSAQDVTFKLKNVLVSTNMTGDPDMHIEQIVNITDPTATGENVTDYNAKSGYSENNIDKDTHTFESSLSQATNITTNISLSSFTTMIDKPKNNVVIMTTESLGSNSLSNMKTMKPLTNSLENRTLQYFTENLIPATSTQSTATVKSGNISYESENDKNNKVLSTKNNSSSNTNGNNTMRFYDTVADIGNNTDITNNTSTGFELVKPVIDTDSNSFPRTTLNNNILQTNIDKNKRTSGNTNYGKVDNNLVYKQISTTIATATLSELVLTASSYNSVKTNKVVLAEPYNESQDRNPLPNIQNISNKINASDDIFQKDSTSFRADKGNKLAKHALLSQTIIDPAYKNQQTEYPNEMQSNNANNSKLNNYQTRKLNFDCLYRYRGRYADNENCRQFYICIGKQYPIIGMCPVNTVFSEFRKQCTKNLSHCIRNYTFYCTSEGRFSDIFNNNIYYICVSNIKNKFVRYTLQCENGYQLDKNSVKCVPNVVKTQSTLDSDSFQRSSDISATNSNESRKITDKGDDFKCEQDGKFPDPNNCRKYYVCSKHKLTFKRKIKSCDSDEVFDKHKTKCVEAESYDC